MFLSPGARLGPYEVVAKIGEGGMGEVWRAHDTQLNRDVALKILPDAFAADPDRPARFEREAQLLASLNHPNIAAIYGIEEAEGQKALVLELVEGPTLGDRIAHGALPVDKALPIARQIAEALEAAHEAGVIHRDLKPANIKVRDDGTVKVLDFGLAKALDPPSQSDPSLSPTLTAAATQQGVVLGTAAYMSPEQASGEATDKRCDIWSFGVVLFEMLTGRGVFEGKTVAHVMSAVLQADPKWERLPPSLPPHIVKVLRRCLEKDPKRRLRDIGDALVELDETVTPEPHAATPTRSPNRRPALAWIGGAVLVGAVVAGLTVRALVPVPDAVISRFQIPVAGRTFGGGATFLALSPDGRTLAYVAVVQDGDRRLYRRSMDQLEAFPIRGTEGAAWPFFSPDGEWVGFFAGGGLGDLSLKKVSLTGGPPTTLTPPLSGFRGASWGPDGTIVFAGGGEYFGLWLVADVGGAPQQLAAIDDEATVYLSPRFLPDGNAVLFASLAPGDRPPQVAVYDLETGRQKVLLDGSSPRVTATGHLLFTREDSLWAVPFDSGRMELTGEPAPVLEGVHTTNAGVGELALGANGPLVYVSASGDVAGNFVTTLVRVGRDGVSTPLAEIAGNAWYPRFSPAGTPARVAFAIAGGQGAAGDANLWVLDFDRGTRTRLTDADNNRFYPTWSPDGTQLAFAEGAGATNRILLTAADGSGEFEPLLDINERQFPMSWAPDGSALALYQDTPENGRDLTILPLDGDRTPVLFLSTPFQDRGVSFSPNGRWLAYVSAESGQDEIYVRPYPGPGGQETVSNGGGQEAVWGPDGTELFYRNGNQLMVVAVETQDAFSAQAPTVLFEGRFVLDNAAGGGGNPNYDIAPDGQSFVMVSAPGGETAGDPIVTPITVVLNWHRELLERVPAK